MCGACLASFVPYLATKKVTLRSISFYFTNKTLLSEKMSPIFVYADSIELNTYRTVNSSVGH